MSKKILIIGPSWVGDMVMAQTLFRLLKKQDPNIVIDVLAPDWTRALLDRMPEVNQSMALPFKHGEFNIKKRWQFGRDLIAKQYDQSIVLPNSWKSAIIPYAAKIPVRTGWLGECRWGLLNNIYYKPKQWALMIERFMALGVSNGLSNQNNLKKPYLLPKLKINQDNLTLILEKFNLNKNKPILVLCPGAEFGPAKRWPTEHFASVAKTKISDGWQVWILGSPKDKPMADEIQGYTDNACIDLSGQTNLAEAIDLMSLAQSAVCNDSGLMHIAAALDIPVVVPYGSSSPDFTPPLGERVAIANLNLECSPCF